MDGKNYITMRNRILFQVDDLSIAGLLSAPLLEGRV